MIMCKAEPDKCVLTAHILHVTGSFYTLLCLTPICSSLISISLHIASGFEQLLIPTVLPFQEPFLVYSVISYKVQVALPGSGPCSFLESYQLLWLERFASYLCLCLCFQFVLIHFISLYTLFYFFHAEGRPWNLIAQAIILHLPKAECWPQELSVLRWARPCSTGAAEFLWSRHSHFATCQAPFLLLHRNILQAFSLPKSLLLYFHFPHPR